MIKNNFYQAMMWFWALLITFIVLFFCGCNSKKKFVKYATLHPAELAALCADTFKPEIRLIQGRSDTISKTEYIIRDSIPCPPVEAKNGKIITKYVKCPDAEIITNTIFKTDTLIKTDAAKEFALQSKLTRTERDLKDEKESKAKWKLTGIIAIIVGGALLFLMIARK